MKRVIVTGFEPFGPYSYNPVQDIAREYDGKVIGDKKITGLVLPCTYYGAFKLLSQKIDEISPNAIISCGLASRVRHIQLETVGKNVMRGKYPDANGRSPQGDKIISTGKPKYSTNSDLAHLSRVLTEANIPISLSADAEEFICNSLIYLTARKIYRDHLPIKFAFFHTPWTSDYLNKITLEPSKVTIPKNDLRKTIEVLVKEIR